MIGSRGNRFRSRTFRLVFGAMLAALPASAQPPQFRRLPAEIDIRIGFDGLYRAGRWVPVTVTATTEDYAFADDLTVVTTRLPGRNDVYRLPLRLERNSAKRYGFLAYLPNEESEYTFRLSERKREIPVTARPAVGGERIVVAIGEEELPVIRPAEPEEGKGGRAAVSVAAGRPETLPRCYLGYGGVDLLVVRGSLSPPLDREQTEAVLEWVTSGGSLLVHPDGFGRVGAELAGVLPVEITETKPVPFRSPFGGEAEGDASGPPELILPVFALRPGAKVLVGESERPALVSGSAGLGRALFCPYDLSASWVRKQAGHDDFWRAALEEATAPRRNHPRYYGADGGPVGGFAFPAPVLRYLARIPGPRMPSLLLVILFLGSYLAVIGPGLFYILNRRKQRERSVIFIPAASVVFALAGLSAGYVFGARQTHLRQLELVRAVPGFSKGRSVCGFSVSVPGRGSYGLSGKPAPLFFLDLAVDTDWRETSGATFVHTIGGEGQAFSFDMNAWTVKSFTTEQMVPLEGGVAADVRIRDGSLSGAVENGLPFDLEGAFLVWGEEAYPLGDLERRRARSLDGVVPPTVAAGPGEVEFSGFRYAGSITASMLTAERYGPHRLGLGDLAMGEALKRHALAPEEVAEAYAALLQSEWTQMGECRPTCFIIGSTRNSFTEPALGGQGAVRGSRSVILWPLEGVRGDRLILGMGSFRLDWDLAERFQPWSSEVTGEMRVPVAEAGRVRALEIQSDPTIQGKMSVLHREQGWVPLPAATGEPPDRYPLEPPSGFLDPVGGEIRLRAEAVSPQTLGNLRVHAIYDQG